MGANLPTNSPLVRFGNNLVTVLSSSSNQLVLKSPALQPGLYNFNLVGPTGNAMYY